MREVSFEALLELQRAVAYLLAPHYLLWVSAGSIRGGVFVVKGDYEEGACTADERALEDGAFRAWPVSGRRRRREGPLKEMKVKVPTELHVRVWWHKVLTNQSISETVQAALDRYFVRLIQNDAKEKTQDEGPRTGSSGAAAGGRQDAARGGDDDADTGGAA